GGAIRSSSTSRGTYVLRGVLRCCEALPTHRLVVRNVTTHPRRLTEPRMLAPDRFPRVEQATSLDGAEQQRPHPLPVPAPERPDPWCRCVRHAPGWSPG